MTHFKNWLTRWFPPELRGIFLFVTITRLVAVPLRAISLLYTDWPSDFRYFLDLAKFSDQGLYPYLHYWVEYPPVFPWISTLLYRLSVALAPGQAADAVYFTLLGWLVVACELGVLALIYQISLLLADPQTARRSVWLYALLFIPAYLWTGWFDHLPVLLLLGALYLLLIGRERSGAVLAVLGMLTKLFPALVLPLGFAGLRSWRSRLIFAAVSLAVFLIVLLPLTLANPPAMLMTLQNMGSRGSWETIWALLDGYYGYGVVVSEMEQHLDMAAALPANHQSQLPWLWITVAFGALYLGFWLRFWGKPDRHKLVMAAGFSVCWLLLYSKGYSPQYLTWLAPLLVILWPDRRGMVVLGLLSLANLLELPVYLTIFPDQHWLLILTVLVRTALLVWLGLDFLCHTWRTSVTRLKESRL